MSRRYTCECGSAANDRESIVMTSVRVPKRGMTFYDQGRLMCVVDASAARVFWGVDSSTVSGSYGCTPAEFEQRFGAWFEDRDYRTITTPCGTTSAEPPAAGDSDGTGRDLSTRPVHVAH